MKFEKWDDNTFISNLKAEQIPKALNLAGEVIKGEAKLNCPTDTSNTKNSINHKLTEDYQAVQVGVPSDGDLAFWLEFGTGIYAENGQGRKDGWWFVTDHKIKKMTPVYTTKDGKFVYFTHGMRPQPFLRPGLYNSKEAIKKIFKVA